jgi:hypothetical protein
MDVAALVERGAESAARERYRYSGGRVELIEETRAGIDAEKTEAPRAPVH